MARAADQLWEFGESVSPASLSVAGLAPETSQLCEEGSHTGSGMWEWPLGLRILICIGFPFILVGCESEHIGFLAPRGSQRHKDG